MNPPQVTRVTLSLSLCLSLCLSLAISVLGISVAQARPAAPERHSTTAQTPAAKAYSRAQRKKRAAAIMQSSLAGWKKIKARKHTGIDATFDWNDNGCTASFGPISAPNRAKFNSACERHDFGYRNLGHGYYGSKNLALSSFPGTKDSVDKILLADEYTICGSSSSCRNVAKGYYVAVQKTGAAQTAFYQRECQPGYFCLFDDTDYGDRRIALRAGVSDFNDIDFGDKTSSVANFTSQSWRIYDDNGYSDTSHCFAPRARSTDLSDDYGFGDKTSSARPRSSC